MVVFQGSMKLHEKIWVSNSPNQVRYLLAMDNFHSWKLGNNLGSNPKPLAKLYHYKPPLNFLIICKALIMEVLKSISVLKKKTFYILKRNLPDLHWWHVLHFHRFDRIVEHYHFPENWWSIVKISLCSMLWINMSICWI